MKRAVIRADYLFYLTNHDRTHTSLWGCIFEQWHCGTVGPWSFTSLLLLEWRSTKKYSPLFTKGNTQFSHNEIHSTQRGFTLLAPPPMANHCSAPFSMRRILDISSLTPRIQFCETRQESFRWGSEVESGIFYCAGLIYHPPGSEAGVGVEENTVGEFADFLPLPQQCEKQRKEPKLFAKVGQPKNERRSAVLQKQSSLHL